MGLWGSWVQISPPRPTVSIQKVILVTAVITLSEIRKLSKILKKKEMIFKFYRSNLSEIKQISFMKPEKLNKPVYWFSNIILKEKRELQKYLLKKGIQTRDIFYPLNKQPCFKNKKYIKNISYSFKNSEIIYKSGLSLPSHYNLSKTDLNYVVKVIKNFFKS